MSVTPVGFGVIGARSFVATRAVMPAIDASATARLVATAALGGPVPGPWRALDVGGYEAVLTHPEVEVVYVPLPNGLHHEWVVRAARAGRHVLCEKPLAPDATTARAMAAACRDAGVTLGQAWMTPFDPRWQTVMSLARSGVVGPITTISSTFTFSLAGRPDEPANRYDQYRWDPTLGGGALLDVGIYCLGAVVELWGAEPSEITATRLAAPSGVDATTIFELVWPDGRRAIGRCSFVEPECQRLVLAGPDGRLVVDGDAFTGGAAASTIVVERPDGRVERHTVEPDDPYRRMIDTFAASVRGSSARNTDDSADVLQLLDAIAARSRS